LSLNDQARSRPNSILRICGRSSAPIIDIARR
jgi:hypothetical protein